MGNYIGIYTDKSAIDTQVEGKTDSIPYAFIDDSTNTIYYNTTEEGDAQPNYYSLMVALLDGTTSAEIKIPNGITSIRNYAFANTNVTNVEIPNTVTSIGTYAFYSTSLTTLNIPDTVTYIYDGRSSTNNSYICGESKLLTTVHWPNNASITYIPRYAFDGCTSLTTINMPTTITYVGGYAFNGCTNLILNISSLIYQLVNEGLGAYAFCNCEHVTGDIDAHNLKTIYANCFTGTSITSFTGSQVTTIYNNAFQNCKELTTVQLPSNVTAAGFYNNNNANRQNIFGGCSKLTHVSFGTQESPNTLINGLPSGTFNGCTLLEFDNILLPTNLTAFQSLCFANCINLGTNITIPQKVVTLGANCFNGCTSLEYVDASYVTTIGATCFNNTPNLETVDISRMVTFTNKAFQNSGIRYITVPTTTTAVGFYNNNNAARRNIFDGCQNLHTISFAGNTVINGFADSTFINCSALRWKNITFPTNITVFQTTCFKGCTSLGPVVDIPEKITTITNGTFFGCTNIRMVVFPTTITTLTSAANNNGCFGSCTNLFTFIMKRTTKIAVGAYFCQNIPTNNNNNRVYVPKGTLSEWSSQVGWGSANNHTPYSRGFRLRELNQAGKIEIVLDITYESNTIKLKEIYGGTVHIQSTHTNTIFTYNDITSANGSITFEDEMFNFIDEINITVGTHTANETVTITYTPNTEYAKYVTSATGTVTLI